MYTQDKAGDWELYSSKKPEEQKLYSLLSEFNQNEHQRRQKIKSPQCS